MKNLSIIFLTLVITSTLFAQQFPSQNISLLGRWNNPSQVASATYGVKYNGIWGWHNPNDGREYALQGSASGTYFVEVTNPNAPVLRDFLKGKVDSAIWREIKTYQNYAYIVSDDDGSTFQIVDLSYLPDSVHVVHDSQSIFGESHTIFVDGDKLYCGIPSKQNAFYYKMAVYSLANPVQPVLLRKLEDDFPNSDYVHDMYVRNDTVYASSSYSGLFIYRFEANNTFTLLGSLTSYPAQGYNHSSWLTPNGKTLIFADEVNAGLPVKSLDVSDFNNLTILDTFRSSVGSNATPHNPYVLSNERALIAYYTDGVQMFDISNPSNVTRTGFFDTDTICDAICSSPYHGCWGAYPFLPSGNILASDMQSGLFVLDISQALAVEPTLAVKDHITLFPNPSKKNITVAINSEETGKTTIEITDLSGRIQFYTHVILLQGENNFSLDHNLTPGMYLLSVKTLKGPLSRPFIVTN